jgi:hypothetical protein
MTPADPQDRPAHPNLSNSIVNQHARSAEHAQLTHFTPPFPGQSRKVASQYQSVKGISEVFFAGSSRKRSPAPAPGRCVRTTILCGSGPRTATAADSRTNRISCLPSQARELAKPLNKSSATAMRKSPHVTLCKSHATSLDAALHRPLPLYPETREEVGAGSVDCTGCTPVARSGVPIAPCTVSGLSATRAPPVRHQGGWRGRVERAPRSPRAEHSPRWARCHTIQTL